MRHRIAPRHIQGNQTQIMNDKLKKSPGRRFSPGPQYQQPQSLTQAPRYSKKWNPWVWLAHSLPICLRTLSVSHPYWGILLNEDPCVLPSTYISVSIGEAQRAPSPIILVHDQGLKSAIYTQQHMWGKTNPQHHFKAIFCLILPEWNWLKKQWRLAIGRTFKNTRYTPQSVHEPPAVFSQSAL